MSASYLTDPEWLAARAVFVDYETTYEQRIIAATRMYHIECAAHGREPKTWTDLFGYPEPAFLEEGRGMTLHPAATILRNRAAAYAYDARFLSDAGRTAEADVCSAVAAELRSVAASLTPPVAVPPVAATGGHYVRLALVPPLTPGPAGLSGSAS